MSAMPATPRFPDGVQRLEELARTDATVAPLARLQATMLRAAAQPAWEAELPPFTEHRLADGLPLLHGRSLPVPLALASDLLAHLAAIAGLPWRPQDTDEAGALLQASIVQNGEPIEATAARVGVDPTALATVLGLATAPLLLACGRKAAPLLENLIWDSGFCPVCAAWPLLAELRGLERQRWLRCGRCGAGWPFPHLRCPFCGNADHRTLPYLAPEAAREARQAAACDRCFAYLKTFSTLRPLAPDELLLYDLTSLELDMAALEAEYGRPQARAFPLDLRLEPARSPARRGWLPRLR